MHILRTSSMLVRLVLAWFVLTLGAATAAPMVQPASMVLVCAQDGTRIVFVDTDGAVVHAKGHTLDCPLCLPAAVPTTLAVARAPLPQPPLVAMPVALAFHAVPIPGAPLPPRGPPAHS